MGEEEGGRMISGLQNQGHGAGSRGRRRSSSSPMRVCGPNANAAGVAQIRGPPMQGAARYRPRRPSCRPTGL